MVQVGRCLARCRNLRVRLYVHVQPPGQLCFKADHDVDPSGEIKGLVRCSVLDQGPGIPPEERERIFERFYRVERHRSKTPGSTGLGLAIVRHIVERHGGRVWVERGRGEMPGAAFHFTLPLAQPRKTDPAAEAPAPGPRTQTA